MSFIFVEVMFFEISENKNPSKITRYTVQVLIRMSQNLTTQITNVATVKPVKVRNQLDTRMPYIANCSR